MITIFIFLLINISILTTAGNPCAARYIEGASVVCVCNVSYCDHFKRVVPDKDTFITYTSSEDGLRFKCDRGFVQKYDKTRTYDVNMVMKPDLTYQTMFGFGGAVTDSAGINWKSLSKNLRNKLVESYFGDTGLQYTFIRVPIGGSDFSTRSYSYNELPENDSALTNFTLAPEDNKYKIPMIKACQKASSSKVNVLASTWSPPAWMKTNATGASLLKKEYLQTYADYHLKFLELYAAEGVDMWGITTSNEPLNGVIGKTNFNCLGWTPKLMAQWIDENLGPTIRNSYFKHTKILAVDDQRSTLPIWFTQVINIRPNVLNWIDGVAVHYYKDSITSPTYLEAVTKYHPDKFVLATEASLGIGPNTKTVDLGSWDRAKTYILDMIQDINYGLVGWLDWNLCLNPSGGPNWASNEVDAAVIVYENQQEFVKQPMFYALGHFSKFVVPGSKMIYMKTAGKAVNSVAFVTPKKTIVAVIYNDNDRIQARLRFGTQQAVVSLPATSVTTIELKLNPQQDYHY